MLHFRYMNEKKNDEYIQKIREVDFNDIVDIIWEGGDQMMIVKSNVEKLWRDIQRQSEIIVIHWIGSVEKDKDKQSCIELMMQERYKKNFPL